MAQRTPIMLCRGWTKVQYPDTPWHDVAVPVSKFKQQMGKIVLPGATKDALKAVPKFEYAR